VGLAVEGGPKDRLEFDENEDADDGEAYDDADDGEEYDAEGGEEYDTPILDE